MHSRHIPGRRHAPQGWHAAQGSAGGQCQDLPRAGSGTGAAWHLTVDDVITHACRTRWPRSPSRCWWSATPPTPMRSSQPSLRRRSPRPSSPPSPASTTCVPRAIASSSTDKALEPRPVPGCAPCRRQGIPGACCVVTCVRSHVAVQVKNVIIWGNHSNTQFPDVAVHHHSPPATWPHSDAARHHHQCGRQHHACHDGHHRRGLAAGRIHHRMRVACSCHVCADARLQTVQNRGAAVIKARKLSSAVSAAKAISDHVRTWFLGTAEVHAFITCRLTVHDTGPGRVDVHGCVV